MDNPYPTENFMLATFFIYLDIAGETPASHTAGTLAGIEGKPSNARFLFLPYEYHREMAEVFEGEGMMVDVRLHAQAWKAAKGHLSRFKKEGRWTPAT